MKVGIITFHFVSNQGAVLQCLATQKFLEKNGHEACVIDYRPCYHTIRYVDPKNPFLYAKWYFKKFKRKKPPVRILLAVRSFVRCIYYNVSHADAEVAKAYGEFTNKNLHLTKEYRSLKELQTDPPALDAYVTGSDQLWNPDILDQKLDPAYFLAFGKGIPKVSYAVSLGKKLEGKEMQDLSELSINLTAVSLREYNKEATDSIGRDVHICLDPTLLLDAGDYAFYENKRKEQERYIFVYGFEDTSELHEAVDSMRNTFKCRVVNGSPHRIKINGDTKNFRVYGPDKFLAFIRDAACVVTNSFHGTAFSVIYRKRFITVPHSTRGQRMTDLLEKIGLNQCLWNHPDYDFNKCVDWDEVYTKLQYFRRFSAEYLLAAIEGKGNDEILHADGERAGITGYGMENHVGLKAYYGSIANETDLKTVASGGAATVISEKFVEEGGTVVGVSWSDDFKSAHYECVETKEGLTKLKSSKYIASEKRVGGGLVYDLINKRLQEGRKVLFIGLGCDVAALYKWVENKNVDISNLYTIDLICHGVTFPVMQSAFIEQLERRYGSKVVEYSARNKSKGWSSPSICARFSNGKTYRKLLYETEFGFAFKTYIRKSCYSCKYKGKNHVADITIGDYWGMNKAQIGYRRNGVSILLSRTNKGQCLIDSIAHKNFNIMEGDAAHMIKHNKMYEMSVTESPYREQFEQDFKQEGLHQAVIKNKGYRIYQKAALKNRLLRLTGKK